MEYDKNKWCFFQSLGWLNKDLDKNIFEEVPELNNLIEVSEAFKNENEEIIYDGYEIRLDENKVPYLYKLTELDEWINFVNELPDDITKKKEVLYATLRYKLLDDNLLNGLDKTRPFAFFHGEALTVDEIQDLISKYFGDRDDYVNTLIIAKKTAKDYIRSVV